MGSHMWQGLSSRDFHIIGDSLQANIKGSYTTYKDSYWRWDEFIHVYPKKRTRLFFSMATMLFSGPSQLVSILRIIPIKTSHEVRPFGGPGVPSNPTYFGDKNQPPRTLGAPSTPAVSVPWPRKKWPKIKTRVTGSVSLLIGVSWWGSCNPCRGEISPQWN